MQTTTCADCGTPLASYAIYRDDERYYCQWCSETILLRDTSPERQRFESIYFSPEQRRYEETGK